MNPIRWLLDLTPHELQVLQTLAVVTGSGLVPVFGLILTWFAKGIKYNARQAAEQTRRQDHVDGELRTVSVADIAHRAAHDTDEFRREFHSEITDLANDPVTKAAIATHVHGRRRLPTTDVPLPSHYIGESRD